MDIIYTRVPTSILRLRLSQEKQGRLRFQTIFFNCNQTVENKITMSVTDDH